MQATTANDCSLTHLYCIVRLTVKTSSYEWKINVLLLKSASDLKTCQIHYRSSENEIKKALKKVLKTYLKKAIQILNFLGLELGQQHQP